MLPNKLLSFLCMIVRPYKRYLLGMAFTGFVWGLYLSFAPLLLKVIIDTVSSDKNPAEAATACILPAIMYLLLWIVIAGMYRWLDWLHRQCFPAVRQDITSKMFAYVNQHAFVFFQNQFAGSLSNKISDMQNGSIAILKMLDATFAQLCAVAIAAITMYFVNPLFTAILLGWIVVLFIISFLFSRNIKDLSHVFSESRSTISGYIVDSLSNFVSVLSFARHRYEQQRLDDVIVDVVIKDRRMQWAVIMMRIMQDITYLLMIAGMLFGLLVLYSRGEVSVGDFVLIMTLSLSIAQTIWWLANQLVQFAEDIGKCTQALTIIVQPHEIVDLPNAKPLKVTDGEIRYQNVNFEYKGSQVVYDDLSALIQPRHKVGLVGFSGSGKTTFVNTLMRFFDLDSGTISIDGQDISQVTQASLHECIAMIPQEPSLFHRSLQDNIRFGCLDASDEEVINAAKKAHCHEFIKTLPDGYETFVGERGIKLSGGQRQRIAIARAFLKKAPILVLDEATSALDSVTEKVIHESLHSLMQDKTTIIIAHRLSTLAEVDEILVFDQGKIVESGSHDALLAKNGHYAKLWHMQHNGMLPERA